MASNDRLFFLVNETIMVYLKDEAKQRTNYKINAITVFGWRVYIVIRCDIKG